MNLALPAFLILLGLLPGVCCFYGYFSGRFDRRTAGVSGVEELALYLLLAIPIDTIALLGLEYGGFKFDFGDVTRLLAGPVTDNSAAAIATIVDTSLWTSFYTYVSVLAGGYAVGVVARRLVWAWRIDIGFPILRLRHSWFYRLQGRITGMPRKVLSFVDVLTEHPDGSRLYRGLVVDFSLAPSGAIESLTLLQAKRGRDRGRHFKWIDIPSHSLTIMGGKIHSINVTYVGIDDRPSGTLRRLGHASRTWFRSFILEEP